MEPGQSDVIRHGARAACGATDRIEGLGPKPKTNLRTRLTRQIEGSCMLQQEICLGGYVSWGTTKKSAAPSEAQARQGRLTR